VRVRQSSLISRSRCSKCRHYVRLLPSIYHRINTVKMAITECTFPAPTPQVTPKIEKDEMG